MVKALNAKNWKTLSVDFTHNESSTSNALLLNDRPLSEQMAQITEEVGKFSKEYGTIICGAGGFDISNIADGDILTKYE